MGNANGNGRHLQSLEGGKAKSNTRKIKTPDDLKNELIEAVTNDVLQSIAAVYDDTASLGRFCILGKVKLAIVNGEHMETPLHFTGDMVESSAYELVEEKEKQKEGEEFSVDILRSGVKKLVTTLLLKKNVMAFTEVDVLQTEFEEDGESEMVGNDGEKATIRASERRAIYTQALHKIQGYPKELPPLKKKSGRKPSPPQAS